MQSFVLVYFVSGAMAMLLSTIFSMFDIHAVKYVVLPSFPFSFLLLFFCFVRLWAKTKYIYSYIHIYMVKVKQGIQTNDSL